MNDRCEGAIEALSWVLLVLKKKNGRVAVKDIQKARDDLLDGAATDFRDRIKFHA